MMQVTCRRLSIRRSRVAWTSSADYEWDLRNEMVADGADDDNGADGDDDANDANDADDDDSDGADSADSADAADDADGADSFGDDAAHDYHSLFSSGDRLQTMLLSNSEIYEHVLCFLPSCTVSQLPFYAPWNQPREPRPERPVQSHPPATETRALSQVQRIIIIPILLVHYAFVPISPNSLRETPSSLQTRVIHP